MTRLNDKPPFALPKIIASGRVAIGIKNINLDAINPTRGIGPAAILDTQHNPKIVDEFILSLWNDPNNQDVVQAFLKNDFVWYAAQHTDDEVLPYYQAYGIQDYFYLIDCIRMFALRLNNILERDWSNLQAEADNMAAAVKWVTDWRNQLISALKIPAADIDKAERSVGELAYANVLQNHTAIDDWFDLHVILIPCIWGWNKLAKMIDEDPKTKKSTIFYNTWVKPNLDPTPANQLSSFLDANHRLWGSGVDINQGTAMDKWKGLLRTALKLEVALFQSSGWPHAVL